MDLRSIYSSLAGVHSMSWLGKQCGISPFVGEHSVTGFIEFNGIRYYTRTTVFNVEKDTTETEQDTRDYYKIQILEYI